jgi:hypothetical protein
MTAFLFELTQGDERQLGKPQFAQTVGRQQRPLTAAATQDNATVR